MIHFRVTMTGVLTYAVPLDSSLVLGSVFAAMEEHKARLNVQAWAISDTSLEEVFLHIVSVTSTEGAAPKQQMELTTTSAQPAIAWELPPGKLPLV